MKTTRKTFFKIFILLSILFSTAVNGYSNYDKMHHEIELSAGASCLSNECNSFNADLINMTIDFNSISLPSCILPFRIQCFTKYNICRSIWQPPKIF